MRYETKISRFALTVTIAALGFVGGAWAQAYPDRPVRLVIPAPPGGGMDTIGRALAEPLGAALKQPVVIENRAGANSVIGTHAVARAAPDGYTLLLTASFHTMHPWTVKNLPYDSIKDFAAVAPLGSSPLIFVASTGSNVKTVADFRKYVAASKDGVTFATSSTETRLGAELVLQQVGAKGVIVNYKGTGPAMGDIAGGHVPLFVTTFSSVLPFKDTGKVNLIGVAAAQRSDDLPGLPTLAEQGLDVEVGVWYGILAPAGTPPEIVTRLNREITQIGKRPDYIAKLKTFSIQPTLMSPSEFERYINSEVEKWAKVVKAANIQPE
jgi:tripartite-type tricarboxylate transporter receptor subunit TctC